MKRRGFLQLIGGSVAASALPTFAQARMETPHRSKAIALDAFPIFDPRPIAQLTEQLFPGKGEVLGLAWRTRQFEYQWLRALSGRYADFVRTTEDALVFACKQQKLELTPSARERLMQAYFELKAWPDVPAALEALKKADIRLAFLSNMTEPMLRAGMKNAGLESHFPHVLSTDQVRTYKPDPRAYQLGVDAFGLSREEILFVAFAGWDVAGAKWYGYPTFWVNRLNAPAEELGAAADGVGRDLNDLVRFATSAP